MVGPDAESEPELTEPEPAVEQSQPPIDLDSPHDWVAAMVSELPSGSRGEVVYSSTSGRLVRYVIENTAGQNENTGDENIVSRVEEWDNVRGEWVSVSAETPGYVWITGIPPGSQRVRGAVYRGPEEEDPFYVFGNTLTGNSGTENSDAPPVDAPAGEPENMVPISKCRS